MITVTQYFTNPTTGEVKDYTKEQWDAAGTMLLKVNGLLIELAWHWPTDPDTGTCISGARGGSGDGGFRLPDSKTGAGGSKHKSAHAVDVFDPENKLDGMLTDEVLEKFGLYRETPKATNGWCHLQDVAPGSGRRTYDI